jgi:hypothetical protein
VLWWLRLGLVFLLGFFEEFEFWLWFFCGECVVKRVVKMVRKQPVLGI